MATPADRWKCLAAAAALLAAAGAQAGSASPDAGRAASFGSRDAVEWKPSASLPPGFEYHLVREEGPAGGIQALVRLAQGAVLAPHTHDCDETLVVLTGKVRIRSGAEDRKLGPGDYAAIPSGVVHEVRPEGRKGVVMFLATNGPLGFKPAK